MVAEPAESRFIATLKKVFLGSHAKGPLLWDKFWARESLQLHAPYSEAEKERLDEDSYWGERLAKRLRLFIGPMVGVGCGVAATLLSLLTRQFSEFRFGVIDSVLRAGEDGPVGDDGSSISSISLAVMLGALAALALSGAAYLSVLWQPTAASSGIPGVIAFLNGCDVRDALGPKVLLAKLVGTALACGAGLAVGPEGPMIHIGTMVGMMTVQHGFRPALRLLGGERGKMVELQLARDPLRYHIQAAAMGAGAGVAAAFKAPLTGAIFVVEEAASYFSKRMFIQAFVTSACAVFTAMGLEVLLGVAEESMYNKTSWCPEAVTFSPLLMLQALQVGIVCGVLAAGFNTIIVRLNRWRAVQARQFGNGSRLRLWRLGELAAITIVTSSFAVILPAISDCADASLQTAADRTSGCIPEDWLSQLVVGTRTVAAGDVFGPSQGYATQMGFLPAPGLYGAQYNPSECPIALEHLPTCRLRGIENYTKPEERNFYCCGFESLSKLLSQNTSYDPQKPAAPLYMDPGFWPTANCPLSRHDASNKVDIPLYSPAAALLLTNPRSAVRNLLTHGSPLIVPAGELSIFLFGYFTLAAVTSGTWVPGGLVIPMMMIGATVGRLSGLVWLHVNQESWEDKPPIPWVPEIRPLLRLLHQREYDNQQDAGVLAMVGAAAFLSGSGSLVLFVIVLMLEITLDAFLVPVLILAIFSARVTAYLMGSTGLYHELIEVQSLPFLPEHEHWRQRLWLVKDVLDEDARRAEYFANGSNWVTEVNGELAANNADNSMVMSWSRHVTGGSDFQPSSSFHRGGGSTGNVPDLVAGAEVVASGASSSQPPTDSDSQRRGQLVLPEAAIAPPRHSESSRLSVSQGALLPNILGDGQSHSGDTVGSAVASGSSWSKPPHLLIMKRKMQVSEIRAVLNCILPGDSEPVVNGFPVVEETGELCGLVVRREVDLLSTAHADAAVNAAVGGHSESHPSSRPGLSVVVNSSVLGLSGAPVRTSTPDVSSATPTPLLQGSQPMGSHPEAAAPSDAVVDLGQIMDSAPFIVQESMPVHRAHKLFRQLGLRHLVVVDHSHRPLGVLTRKSLMPWRTPWRAGSFLHHDTFREARAVHSPQSMSPIIPRSPLNLGAQADTPSFDRR